MKKIFIILFILVLSIYPNLTCKAEELPTIKVGSCYAYNGEKVSIPITIKNNKGFSYLGAKIRYDSTKLKYVSSKLRGLNNASMKKIDIGINDNGEIASIDFEVINNDLEEIPVEITVDSFGKDRTDIKTKSINGVVKVIDFAKKGSSLDLSDKVQKRNDEYIVNNKDKKDNKTKDEDSQVKKAETIWKSSNEDVATVDKKGNVTFKNNGTVSITARDENNNLLLEKKYKVDDSKSFNSNLFNRKSLNNKSFYRGVFIMVSSSL